MSGARLRALRMVGFKSFAERTVVEFGPGISAIVGPNGSGKSNLADALRWSLGEQGRSLRTRRAEDLIFAGSSSRRAVGMADVTLVIDNTDGLLPLDYAEIELGRRLYRSGENEYLLNRQRVRLRDLVDLLDEANLADNAFLFIGQGMVDQALALRPEERRPLFEEAAGIRKHERRRRTAEAELAEAETNLERVRDLLAELRPQARRLAAQAAQQEQRRSAGAELARALVAAARTRLAGAERQAAELGTQLAGARRDSDAALEALRRAEYAARALTVALSERAEAERAARERLDSARVRTVELRLAEARLAGEAAAALRDRQRVAGERDAILSRVDEARRTMALPVPEIDSGAEEALRAAERALADAEREAVDLREAGLAGEQRDAQTRRAREARRTELEGARRRAADAERRLAQQSAAAAETNRRAADAGSARAECAARAADGERGERTAEAAAEAARAVAAGAEAAWQEAAERAGSLGAELAGARTRYAALSESVRDGLDERTLRVARARGAQRLAEGLEVEPRLRVAVEAALGDALTGLAADARTALALRDARAVVLLPEAGPRPVREGEAARGREAVRAEEAAVARGGGRLADALRRDPRGDVARLVARSVWVPDLESALDLRSVLPGGWSVVTLTGEVVRDDGLVRLGKRESVLERRAAAEAAAEAVRGLEARLGEAVAARDAADATRREGRSALERARAAVEAARRTRRVADEADRSAARTAETAAREAAWQAAQLERIGAVAAATGRELAELEAATTAGRATEEQASGSGTDVERYRARRSRRWPGGCASSRRRGIGGPRRPMRRAVTARSPRSGIGGQRSGSRWIPHASRTWTGRWRAWSAQRPTCSPGWKRSGQGLRPPRRRIASSRLTSVLCSSRVEMSGRASPRRRRLPRRLASGCARRRPGRGTRRSPRWSCACSWMRRARP